MVAKCLAVLLLLAALARSGPSYDKAYPLYRTWIARPSLHKRTLARERLARTGDVRALQVLAASYARPEQPKDFVRYLLVTIATEYLDEDRHVPIYGTWRDKYQKKEDAWLWYRSLRVELDNRGPAGLMAIARGRQQVFLRAAAIEALRLADAEDMSIYQLVEDLARTVPSKPLVRSVLLESLASVLLYRKEQAKTPEFGRAATAVLDKMGENSTPPRTKLVLGRYMARIFGYRNVWRNAKRWKAELKYVQAGGKRPNWTGYSQKPTFAGIEANGDRICYVIDLSDSMCKKLTPAEKKRLPKGPVSGSAASRRKQKEAKNDKWKKAFERVDMSRVRTRFDAARELLKTSLVLLDEKKRYCVIWFGSGAGTLNSTKGMVKASLSNIRKTLAELDAFRVGPKTDDRPWGTLKGATNMHGGLYRAYRVKGRGLVGAGEYVNGTTFTEGCDTIFLLSDGDPTWDDWPALDSRDKGDYVGDPESRLRRKSSAMQLNFPGPYRRPLHLVSDIARLNLFRRCEIHCVGMGEANMNTLQRIAAIGGGKALNLRGR